MVRALRQDDPLAEGFARRAHELWMREREQPVHWTPSELRVGQRVLLASAAAVGTFIWPAYQAGMRALALRDKSTHGDLLRLGKELAALETTALDPNAFGAWLWRGCALGFDVALAGALAERSQMLLEVVPDESVLWTACAERVTAAWKDYAARAARSLPAAALKERFDVPLAALSQQALSGELLLTPEDGDRLRASADDAMAWAAAELGLLASQPALLASLPHAHLGFRMVELIAGVPAVDGRLLAFCAVLTSRAGTGHGLDHALLGDVLARRLLEGGQHIAALLDLANRGPEPLFASVLAQLCARGEQKEVVPALRALLEHLGAAATFERIDVAALGTEPGVHLLLAALDDGMAIPELLAVLDRLPLAMALRTVIARPELLSHAQASIEGWLREQPLASAALMPELVEAGPSGARAVGNVLRELKGADLPQPLLRSAFAALVRTGHGQVFVMPLWTTRKLPPPVRLAALAALESDEALLADATHVRGAALLLEPPEIREALEELRWSKRR